MRLDPLQLGPWPKGMDSFHEATHAVFQKGPENVVRVLEGINCDLTDEGWALLRTGLEKKLSLTAATTMFASPTDLFVQDGSVIYRVDENTWEATEIVDTGNDFPVQYCYHGNQVFWTNGVDSGRIDGNDVSRNWGAPLGKVSTVSVGSGSLRAGRYLIALEYKDEMEVVHAADQAVAVTVGASSSIQINVSSLPSYIDYVRVFVGGPDDDMVFFKEDVAVSSFPYTITSISTEDTFCNSFGLVPPPEHTFAFSYQGRIMLVNGRYIYPSLGAAAHLFNVGIDTVVRPESIVAAGGLPDGFWTVSERGAYWAQGDSPAAWKQWDLKHKAQFCTGSFATSTNSLPGLGLERESPAVLFWSNWGLAVGLAGGQMLFPMKDTYREDITGNFASFAYREITGIEQLVVNLYNEEVSYTSLIGTALLGIDAGLQIDSIGLAAGVGAAVGAAGGTIPAAGLGVGTGVAVAVGTFIGPNIQAGTGDAVGDSTVSGVGATVAAPIAICDNNLGWADNGSTSGDVPDSYIGTNTETWAISDNIEYTAYLNNEQTTFAVTTSGTVAATQNTFDFSGLSGSTNVFFQVTLAVDSGDTALKTFYFNLFGNKVTVTIENGTATAYWGEGTGGTQVASQALDQSYPGSRDGVQIQLLIANDKTLTFWGLGAFTEAPAADPLTDSMTYSITGSSYISAPYAYCGGLG